eukprot:310144-Prorocentrum_minimum.AAC.1
MAAVWVVTLFAFFATSREGDFSVDEVDARHGPLLTPFQSPPDPLPGAVQAGGVHVGQVRSGHGRERLRELDRPARGDQGAQAYARRGRERSHQQVRAEPGP